MVLTKILTKIPTEIPMKIPRKDSENLPFCGNELPDQDRLSLLVFAQDVQSWLKLAQTGSDCLSLSKNFSWC